MKKVEIIGEKELLKMGVILIRSVILYILVIFAVRLMGKRQLGELQPSELVITILVSNIATLPLEDTGIPLIVGLTPVLTLVCYEVLMSWLSLKLPWLRKAVSGSPKIIISGGKIENNVLNELRLSVDDLMMSLRSNGVFSIDEVQYAVVETTGNISVMRKAGSDTPTCSDLSINKKSSDPPQVVVSDGILLEKAADSVGVKASEIRRIISEKGLNIEEVLVMTADSGGKWYIADKSGSEPKTGGM